MGPLVSFWGQFNGIGDNYDRLWGVLNFRALSFPNVDLAQQTAVEALWKDYTCNSCIAVLQEFPG